MVVAEGQRAGASESSSTGWQLHKPDMEWKDRFKGAAIGLAITIACLPLAAVITLLSGSFWLWFENTFAIEAFGHSGPAEWCYLVTYLCLVAIAGCSWSYLGRQTND